MPNFDELKKILGVTEDSNLLGKASKIVSYPQRYLFNKASEQLGVKGNEESSEESAQGIVENLASRAGIPEDSTLGNALKAAGVAGLEVFGDPVGMVPVGKIAKIAPKIEALKALKNSAIAQQLKKLYKVGDIEFPADDAAQALKITEKLKEQGKVPKNVVIQDLGKTQDIGKTTVIPNKGESQFKQVDSSEFFNQLGKAMEENPKIKDFVHRYSPEELSQMRLFLTPDGKSGFALKPDGDLVSVFSAIKGRGDVIMPEAIAKGGTKLDAFEGYLTNDLYPRYGFKEVRREPNWTKGGPDVVFMERPKKK